jgi:hypothetical protein
MPEGFEAPKKKVKPSRMPNLSYGKDRRPKPRPSVISTAEAINVLALLKQELQRIDCILKSYYIRAHVRGLDIEKIQVYCSDMAALRNRVMDMDGDEQIEHDRMQKVTSLALLAVSGKFKNRLRDELRLEAQLFDFEDSDMGIVSVTVPIERMEPPAPMPAPLPPMPEPMDMPMPSGEEEVPESLGGETSPLPSAEDQVYSPNDGEMDLGSPEEESAPTPGLPGDDELPGAVNPEDEIGRATKAPELI